jgi:Kinesin-associated protein (KAP)
LRVCPVSNAVFSASQVLVRLGRGLDRKTQPVLQHAVIEKVNKFIPVRSNVLMMANLRLLHNLSFDQAVCEDMVAAGLVPKLAPLMADARWAVNETCVM